EFLWNAASIKKAPSLWGSGLEGGLSMKGKKSARGFVARSVQSGDLQDLDVLGVNLEVRGQQAAQLLRIAAFTERMCQLDDPAPFTRVRGFCARDKVRVVAGCHGYKA